MTHLLARAQTHAPHLLTAAKGCFPNMSDVLTMEQEKQVGWERKEEDQNPERTKRRPDTRV